MGDYVPHGECLRDRPADKEHSAVAALPPSHCHVDGDCYQGTEPSH
jgi:hypothetical protein